MFFLAGRFGDLESIQIGFWQKSEDMADMAKCFPFHLPLFKRKRRRLHSARASRPKTPASIEKSLVRRPARWKRAPEGRRAQRLGAK